MEAAIVLYEGWNGDHVFWGTDPEGPDPIGPAILCVGNSCFAIDEDCGFLPGTASKNLESTVAALADKIGREVRLDRQQHLEPKSPAWASHNDWRLVPGPLPEARPTTRRERRQAQP
jgi:hypothetical protein